MTHLTIQSAVPILELAVVYFIAQCVALMLVIATTEQASKGGVP